MKKQFLESVVTYTFLNYLNAKNKYDKGRMSLQELLKRPEKMLESFFKKFELEFADDYLFEWNLKFNESKAILNENYSFDDFDDKIKKSFMGVRVIMENWFSDAWDWGTDQVSGAVDYVSDKATQVRDWAYDKAQKVKKAYDEGGGGLSGIMNVGRKTYDYGVRKVKQGIDWLKEQAAKLFNFSLNDIIEGFRGVVSGNGGTIVQLILSFTGPIGGGIVLAVNALLLLGDIYQFSIGSKNFSYFNVVFDLLGTALAFGSVRAALAPAKTVLAAEKTAAGFFGKLAQKFPSVFEQIKGIGSGIMKAVKWVSSGLQKFISWITKWLPGVSKLIAPIEKALGSLGRWLDDMVKAISNVGKKVGQKVVTKASTVAANFANQPVGQALKNVLIKGQKLGLRGLESKVGKTAVQGVDNYTAGQVEDYLRDRATNITLASAKTAMCGKSTAHCTAVKAFASLAGRS